MILVYIVGFGRFSPKQQGDGEVDRTKKAKVENETEHKKAEDGLWLYVHACVRVCIVYRLMKFITTVIDAQVAASQPSISYCHQ